jgi:transcription elongation factor Elf1
VNDGNEREPPRERVTTVGARVDATCFRCRGREIVLVKVGSEADLVRCETCGFEFGWEQGEI